jgi:anthranilate synthase/aminodeoxychorismate synthase-like glutamine amidotransferase
MIVLVDNYDSFTYNLYQAVRALGADCRVVRNDAMPLKKLAALRPSRLILSPGPGRPEDAGLTVPVIKSLSPKIPTLGVCLGHQAIALAFGGKVVRAEKLMHGKTCRVTHDGRGVFTRLPKTLTVMRYHSLVAEDASLPKCLVPTARAADGAIMGLRHESLPIEGVQFHPESVATPEGEAMIRNFLEGRWTKKSRR